MYNAHAERATLWRATGSYVPTLSSKTSLIEETRQFLLTYARLGDVEAARQALVNGGLPQRSRATRASYCRDCADANYALASSRMGAG